MKRNYSHQIIKQILVKTKTEVAGVNSVSARQPTTRTKFYIDREYAKLVPAL